MVPDEYIYQVLAKYEHSPLETSQIEEIANNVVDVLSEWGGKQLSSISFSGALAKGTTVKGVSDIDLFISFKSSTSNSSRDIYNKLYNLAEENGWNPRLQNASVRIIMDGYKIDLVPAKKQKDRHNWHNLYKNKTNSRSQTNISSHISFVRRSNRINEIKAIKIWRNLNKLNFPSFYLELVVIKALKRKHSYNLADNVITVFRYIAKTLPRLRVVDPANTKNIISNTLTLEEKFVIARTAEQSINQSYWNNIIG